MSMPGFTAEASLHAGAEVYQTGSVQPRGTPQTGVVAQWCACEVNCDAQGNCGRTCYCGGPNIQ
jgi:hypothetical protein